MIVEELAGEFLVVRVVEVVVVLRNTVVSVTEVSVVVLYVKTNVV